MTDINDNVCSIETIKQWDELKKIFKSLHSENSWVYRGQSDSSWTLKTSIDRWKISDKKFGENKLVEIFSKINSSPKILKSKFYYSLCYLQHYGAPTRLLDVTVNPLIACFFALIDCEIDKKCSVFAINRKLFQTNSVSRLRYEQELPQRLKDLIDSNIRSIENEEFLEQLIESNLSGIFAIKPAVSFTRMTRQMGGFLFQGNLNIDFNNNLMEVLQSEYFNSIDSCFHRIVISGNLKHQILKELNDDFKINISYVYPDKIEKYKNLKYIVELE